MSRLWERALFVQRYALARMACVHPAAASALGWQGIVHDLRRLRSAEAMPGGEQATCMPFAGLYQQNPCQSAGQATVHAFGWRHQQNPCQSADKPLRMPLAIDGSRTYSGQRISHRACLCRLMSAEHIPGNGQATAHVIDSLYQQNPCCAADKPLRIPLAGLY